MNPSCGPLHAVHHQWLQRTERLEELTPPAAGDDSGLSLQGRGGPRAWGLWEKVYLSVLGAAGGEIPAGSLITFSRVGLANSYAHSQASQVGTAQDGPLGLQLTEALTRQAGVGGRAAF